MTPDIFDPKVLFVKFENQGGDWAVRIPNAHRDGSDFVAPLTEELSLQFQPVMLSSLLGQETRTGVACVALEFQPEKDEDEKA